MVPAVCRNDRVDGLLSYYGCVEDNLLVSRLRPDKPLNSLLGISPGRLLSSDRLPHVAVVLCERTPATTSPATASATSACRSAEATNEVVLITIFGNTACFFSDPPHKLESPYVFVVIPRRISDGGFSASIFGSAACSGTPGAVAGGPAGLFAITLHSHTGGTVGSGPRAACSSTVSRNGAIIFIYEAVEIAGVWRTQPASKCTPGRGATVSRRVSSAKYIVAKHTEGL